jgi:hypothetical protein
MVDPMVALVRQAIFTVLDEREWDFENDEQRVDFADRVVTFIPSERDIGERLRDQGYADVPHEQLPSKLRPLQPDDKRSEAAGPRTPTSNLQNGGKEPPNEREELVKDLRHFAAVFRGEGREIEADVMDEAAQSLGERNYTATEIQADIDAFNAKCVSSEKQAPRACKNEGSGKACEAPHCYCPTPKEAAMRHMAEEAARCDKPHDTPRLDALLARKPGLWKLWKDSDFHELASLARQLERELAAAIKAGESVQRDFNEYRRVTHMSQPQAYAKAAAKADVLRMEKEHLQALIPGYSPRAATGGANNEESGGARTAAVADAPQRCPACHCFVISGEGIRRISDWLMTCYEERDCPSFRDERLRLAAEALRRRDGHE